VSLADIIARAAPPPERADSGAFEFVVTDEASWARRRERLNAAFGSINRLALHAEELGVAPDAWIDRFRDVTLVGDPPDWAHAFGAIFERLTDGPAPYAEVRRWAKTEAEAAWPSGLPRGPDALEGPLDYLASRFGAVLQQTFQFERRLGSRSGWAGRFRRSPGLAYALGRVACDWLADLTTMIIRVAADRALLARAIFGGLDPGTLIGIEAGLGDPHAGGRSVAILRFQRGAVVYKPKDLRVADVVDEIAGLLPEAGLATPRRLSRDGYAWENLCEVRALKGRDEAEAFFRTLGAWLAVLHPLGATDFWFDNLIAEGATPRFVDFETAVQPPIPPPPGVLPAFAWTALEASPLHTGILPWPIQIRDGEDPTDIGCMARPGLHRMPLTAPGFKTLTWHEDRFAPHFAEGVPADAADYFGAFEDGYFQVAGAFSDPTLCERAVEILGRAGDAPVRIIRIDTWTCYGMVNASLAPRHLADGVWREIALHAALDMRGDIGVLREAAVRDLRRLDIPLFHTRLDSRDLFSCEGERQPAFFEKNAITAARDRFRNLAGLTVDERAAWLRSGFGMRADNPPWRTPTRAAPAPAHADDLLAWSDEIATDIQRLAIADDDGGPNWIGRFHDVFTGMQSVIPLGFDILSGRAGLALALHELAERLGRPALADLARETLSGAARDYLNHMEVNLPYGAGYLVGAGGLINALAGEPGLRQLAAEVFRQASRQEIWMQSGDDYVSGLAGWREAAHSLGAAVPVRHGAQRPYAPSAVRRLARWLTPEDASPLCPDRHAAARLHHDRERHGSWFAALWLDDRHNLSGVDGVPALALAFARLAAAGG
jgi:lantibiotic modifying enzyme